MGFFIPPWDMPHANALGLPLELTAYYAVRNFVALLSDNVCVRFLHGLIREFLQDYYQQCFESYTYRVTFGASAGSYADQLYSPILRAFRTASHHDVKLTRIV